MGPVGAFVPILWQQCPHSLAAVGAVPLFYIKFLHFTFEISTTGPYHSTWFTP